MKTSRKLNGLVAAALALCVLSAAPPAQARMRVEARQATPRTTWGWVSAAAGDYLRIGHDGCVKQDGSTRYARTECTSGRVRLTSMTITGRYKQTTAGVTGIYTFSDTLPYSAPGLMTAGSTLSPRALGNVCANGLLVKLNYTYTATSGAKSTFSESLSGPVSPGATC